MLERGLESLDGSSIIDGCLSSLYVAQRCTFTPRLSHALELRLHGRGKGGRCGLFSGSLRGCPSEDATHGFNPRLGLLRVGFSRVQLGCTRDAEVAEDGSKFSLLLTLFHLRNEGKRLVELLALLLVCVTKRLRAIQFGVVAQLVRVVVFETPVGHETLP